MTTSKSSSAAPRPELVIAETASSTWHYHLREVGPGGLFLSGGAPPAICGRPLGWDTRAPLASWNHRGHVPIRYCQACDALARERGYTLPERGANL